MKNNSEWNEVGRILQKAYKNIELTDAEKWLKEQGDKLRSGEITGKEFSALLWGDNKEADITKV